MTPEIFDDRSCSLGEGPGWDAASGRVHWVDILGCRVLWRSPTDGTQGVIATSAHVGAAVLRKGGGFVVTLPEGAYSLTPEGKQTLLAPFPRMGTVPTRANDAKVDPEGALWLGTMAYDDNVPGQGALYRLDPATSALRLAVPQVSISNGLGWSPDGRTMYYIDTPTRRVDAFDFAPGGTIGNRRPLVTCGADDGWPDGLAVDAEGGVWVAFWQGSAVRRYDARGRLDRVVRLPVPLVTSCAFVGPALDRLVITTASVGLDPKPALAGCTFIIDPGTRGLPVAAYAG